MVNATLKLCSNTSSKLVSELKSSVSVSVSVVALTWGREYDTTLYENETAIHCSWLYEM